jgi:hypothetical protein
MNRICFCCEKALESSFPDHDTFSTPPNDATCWTSIGNYGSTVFDGGEFTSEQLEMYICDSCLVKKAKLVYHFKLTTSKKVEDLKPFEPSKRAIDLNKG